MLIKIIALLLLSMMSLSISYAGQLLENQGNIFYQEGQEKTQLTTSGRDSQAVLSPDGKQVVFVRAAVEADNPADELWLMDISGNNAHAIVLSQNDADMKQHLSELNNPLFALNGKAVYFLSAAWATSNAVHVLDLSTNKQHFVTDGNSVDIVPSGKYKSYLIVSKHKYHKGGGSYEDFWLVSPKGKAIKSLGEEQAQVNAFIRAN
jgi:Tol biopolymer transport system component